MKLFNLTFSIFGLGLFYSCTPEPIQIIPTNQIGILPDEVVEPFDNLSNEDKVALGKNLFWDPILSGNKDVACVTCHHPSHAYAEKLQLSIGVGGTGLSANRSNGLLVKRNSMTILNTAFNGLVFSEDYDPSKTTFFWDNRAESLEEQALLPILSSEEMRGDAYSEQHALDSIINRLNAIPKYKDLFEKAFGDKPINAINLAKAIAAFERTLISNNSPFDQFIKGDENALTSLEKRGMLSFVEVGCANCHGGSMFSNFKLHVLTVPENEKLSSLDKGDGTFAFRTPSLRNVELTPPYMHNGIFNSLEEVMEFYDDVDEASQNRFIANGERDILLNDLNIPDDKVAGIIAFLKALSDEEFDKEILEEVPSGLNPGGAID